jgi:adenylate cyclase
MSWWARSSLRRKIFVAFSALILAVLLATLGLTQFIVSREAQRTLSRELLTTGLVVHRLMAERAERLQNSSVLLASDFALKKVMATRMDPAKYDAETFSSVAENYQSRVGVELLWITDETGVLLGLSPGSAHLGHSMASLPPLKEALDSQGATTGIAEIDGSLFQLVVVPVLAPDVIGYLVLGHVIDDTLAQKLKEDTNTEVSFLTDEQMFASSWAPAARKQFVPVGRFRAKLLDAAPADRLKLLTIGGSRFLSLVVPMADARLSKPLYALVQGSYDEALAPLRSLTLQIAAIGATALLVALLVGIGLASGISDPVRTLVTGMHEVLRGNLRYRSRIERQDEIGFLARSFNEMVDGLEEREHVKDTFGRFVSRDVAEHVLAGRVPLEGEKREVSILFQDIRGFTALSEKLDPATLLNVLNRFFTEVVGAVEAEGGVVKQFTGDGVMALFGAPEARADHAPRAVRAALGIVARLEGLNVLLEEKGFPPLTIGIGIHAGEVVAGLIGPDERVEYGVVGEPVNLAARVEALTKDVVATILVSGEIASRLGSEFQFGRTESLPVKGKTEPVRVVEILPPTDASAGGVLKSI